MIKDKEDVSDPMEGFDKVESEQGSYDDSAVVNKIQQHLKEYGGAGDDVDEGAPPIPESKSDPTEEDGSTPIEGGKKSADESESTSDTEDEQAAGDDGGKQKSAIPDNHYRALLHSGWKPEKVSSLYEKDPELLLELAEKAYEDVNNLSQQFAQLGRSRIEMDKQKQKADQPPAQQPIQPAQQGPDLVKLRQQYEDDPFGATVELLKAFVPQSQEPHMQMPIQQPQSQPKEEFQEDLALAQHLISFFGDSSMESYKDFYGATYDDKNHPYLSTDHLTPGQRENRRQVLTIADQILAGASFQGREMPIQEALAMAHITVSGPITKQIVRNELVSQVKKKAKGVTLKPTSRKATLPKKAGEAKTEKELEKATEERLQRYKEGKPLK